MESLSNGSDSSVETQVSLPMKDKLGYLYFEYQDVSSPYWRIPIAQKVFLFVCDSSNSTLTLYFNRIYILSIFYNKFKIIFEITTFIIRLCFGYYSLLNMSKIVHYSLLPIIPYEQFSIWC